MGHDPGSGARPPPRTATVVQGSVRLPPAALLRRRDGRRDVSPRAGSEVPRGHHVLGAGWSRAIGGRRIGQGHSIGQGLWRPGVSLACCTGVQTCGHGHGRADRCVVGQLGAGDQCLPIRCRGRGHRCARGLGWGDNRSRRARGQGTQRQPSVCERCRTFVRLGLSTCQSDPQVVPAIPGDGHRLRLDGGHRRRWWCRAGRRRGDVGNRTTRVQAHSKERLDRDPPDPVIILGGAMIGQVGELACDRLAAHRTGCGRIGDREGRPRGRLCIGCTVRARGTDS